MAKHRSRRGNGRSMFSTGAPDIEEERPEDVIVVVDEEGNPFEEVEPDLVEPVDEPADDDPVALLEQQKAELQREQQARQATEAQLARERQQSQALQRDNHETTKALFAAALASSQDGLKGAKAKYAAAAAQGDWDGAADAQAEIARFTQEIGEIERTSRDLGDAPAPRQQPQTEVRPVDFEKRVDAYIGQLSPAQAEFARKHRAKLFPENDQKPLKKAMALANVAAIEHGVDTPEFFAYIEAQMGLTDDPPKPKPTPAVTRAKRPPIAAAPGARGGVKPTVQVELSAAEREAAKRLGMTPARYALRKKEATEGAKDPNYRGPRYSKDDPATSGAR